MSTASLPESVINTDALLDHTAQITLWHNPNALNRDHLCVVAYALVPALRKHLSPAECYTMVGPTGDVPCLILGHPQMRPDGKYYPRENYPIAEVIQNTLHYAAIQARKLYAETFNEDHRQRYEMLDRRVRQLENQA